MGKTKSKSSRQWLNEHFNDPYVKRAQEEGYRSRAVYKLIEIQEKDKIIKAGMAVVDLGAAPGGWSELAVKWVGPKGKVIALDILPIDPIKDVEVIEGDFTEQEVLDELLATLQGKPVDVVLSDMAPNMSGIASSDQAKSMYLIELALDFCRTALKPGGSLLFKAFHGEGFDDFLTELRKSFKQVQVRKPKASRARSKEVYLLAKQFVGAKK